MKNYINIKNYNRFIIDYSNINNNLIKYQKNFLDYKKLKFFFESTKLGMPLVCPIKLNYFDYKKKNFYSVSENNLKKKIFSLKKKKAKYLHADNFFKFGNVFATDVKLKKNYKNLYLKISKHNNLLKKIVYKLKKSKKTVGAFQTRNIPHLGHEKIILMLLKKCDVVIINPVIGPKKKGDVKPEVLRQAFNYLSKKYYNKKIIFFPVYANMFYAGPREAIHHTNLREMIGFDYFIIGRDHAGAENYYEPLASQKLVLKNQKNFKIKVITHKGSYFCKTHNKIVIKDECKKKNCNYLNISGVNFRKKLKKKELFKFARKDLQINLLKYKKNFFY